MSKQKLLLADDSVTIQKVVNLTFADEGIEVISVSDGDSAMEKVAEISPDLIMADVNMPGLSGYQICEQIRSDAGLCNTPVILLVGSFEPFDENEARRVGANDFLTKPFQSIRQLVTKVTDLLNSGKVAESNLHNRDNDNIGDFSVEEKTEHNVTAETAQNSDTEPAEEAMTANQANIFSLDDAHRYSTQIESADKDSMAKTEDLTDLTLKDFEVVETRTESDELMEIDSAHDELPLPEAASVLQLDEGDLLELPPIESDFEFEEDEETDFDESPAEESYMENGENLSQAPHIETVEQNINEENNFTKLSPEIIDEIVQKVMEKLTDKAVKEVAWEVVPPMTELIVKKMVEEKLKE